MTYTTKQGDMWDKIAFDQLGSTSYVDKLINANKEHCFTFIFPAGVKLTLPEIQKQESTKIPPWKKVNG